MLCVVFIHIGQAEPQRASQWTSLSRGPCGQVGLAREGKSEAQGSNLRQSHQKRKKPKLLRSVRTRCPSAKS